MSKTTGAVVGCWLLSGCSLALDFERSQLAAGDAAPTDVAVSDVAVSDVAVSDVAVSDVAVSDVAISDAAADVVSDVAAADVVSDVAAADGCAAMVERDPLNCGRCGVRCQGGEACVGGACVATCRDPMVQCGSTCVDTLSHPQHCGSCDRACGPGSPRCCRGVCATRCP